MADFQYGVKWRAFVTDNRDPERRFRIKAKVPDLLQNPATDELGETDWALPAHGAFKYVPEIGAGVWIEFEASTESPHAAIWSGEYASVPDGLSEIINVAQEPRRGPAPDGRGLIDVVTPDFSDLSDAAPPSETWTDPESFAEDDLYGGNAVAHSPKGRAFVELDDTGSGRIHSKVGDYYHEVTGDGVESKRVTVKVELVMESENRLVDGPKTETIGGDAVTGIEGDAATQVKGLTYFQGYGPGRIRIAGVTLDFDHDGDGLSVDSVSDINLLAGALLAQAGTLLLQGTNAAHVASGGTAALTGVVSAEVGAAVLGAGARVRATPAAVLIERYSPTGATPAEPTGTAIPVVESPVVMTAVEVVAINAFLAKVAILVNAAAPLAPPVVAPIIRPSTILALGV